MLRLLTGGRGLRVGRAGREQVVMVAGRRRGVQFRRGGRRGEAGGERGRREVGAPAPARPRRVRGRVRVSPRVVRRELAHVWKHAEIGQSLLIGRRACIPYCRVRDDHRPSTPAPATPQTCCRNRPQRPSRAVITDRRHSTTLSRAVVPPPRAPTPARTNGQTAENNRPGTRVPSTSVGALDGRSLVGAIRVAPWK